MKREKELEQIAQDLGAKSQNLQQEIGQKTEEMDALIAKKRKLEIR